MHTDSTATDALTRKVIGCAFKVANTMGIGFLEKVYENALAHELRKADLSVARQVPAKVAYDGVVVGAYVADMIVEATVLVEVKAVRSLDRSHAAQCINYLRATGLWVGLLLNFGSPRLEVKRFVSGDGP